MKLCKIVKNNDDVFKLTAIHVAEKYGINNVQEFVKDQLKIYNETLIYGCKHPDEDTLSELLIDAFKHSIEDALDICNNKLFPHESRIA